MPQCPRHPPTPQRRPWPPRRGRPSAAPAAWLAGALVLAGLAGLAGAPVRAQGDEAALKAAIVFNVLNYVQWPGETDLPAGTPLRLCVERGSPLWPHLAGLRDRPLRQFRLAPRELAEGEAPRDCDALLLDGGNGHRHHLPGQAPGLLTLANEAHADDRGVMLGLRHGGDRVVFDVDLSAARRNGLQISSKLLRLARAVRE